MRDGRTIADKLGGHRGTKGWSFCCPCHNDRRASAAIYDNTGIVKCFAGCTREELEAKLDELGLVDDGRTHKRSVAIKEYDPPPDPEVLGIWGAAEKTNDTLAESYLRSRGITIAPFERALRFHPQAINPSTHRTQPALVALVYGKRQHNGLRRPIGLQLTFLHADGTKHFRHNIGTFSRNAVWLAEITRELGLAEGTETALSAMQIAGVPCWSTLGVSRLDTIWIPSGVKRLHLFGDNDEPGRNAVARAVKKYTSAGLRVKVWWPPEGCNDFNDVLKLQTRVAA
jgi:putative DNA primase/helicase